MEQFLVHTNTDDDLAKAAPHHHYDSFDRLRDWGLFLFSLAQLVLLIVVLVFVVREKDGMETAATALAQISQALTALAGGGGSGQNSK